MEHNHVVQLSFKGSSLSSRITGATVRSEIAMHIASGTKVTVDLDGIDMLTGGFADEAFAVLVKQFGYSKLKEHIKFVNASNYISKVISEAILIRVKEQSHGI